MPGAALSIRPGVDLAGLRATVMGLGHFSGGVETVRWLAAKGARVTVTDLKTAADLRKAVERISDLDVRLALGGHARRDFTDCDLVVASPAVPPESPFLAAAADAGVPLMTELSLTMALLRSRVVWVTGTCGKSTTTALLGECLRAAGIRAHVGGNIGRALVGSAEKIPPEETVVLEVSSFQLEWMARDEVTPDLAVVTNVTPNHLDRHETFERYLAAKSAALPRSGRAILSRDDPACRERLGERAGSAVFWTSLAEELENGAFLRGDVALFREEGREEGLFAVGDVRLLGNFNLMNALQAALAARLLGAGPSLGDALRAFTGLPHRLEDLGARGGIRGVNDSKATTPEASCRALRALTGGIVLVAGGLDRGADLGDFAREIRRRARAAILIGESASRLGREIGEGGTPECVPAATIEEAVAEGLLRCRPGDTLLLSPGHASWDAFANYEERGERFRRAFEKTGED